MYQDPKLIKKHQIKISVDDEVNELLEALTNASGGQKSVVARDILMRGLAQSVKSMSNRNISSKVVEGQ